MYFLPTFSPQFGGSGSLPKSFRFPCLSWVIQIGNTGKTLSFIGKVCTESSVVRCDSFDSSFNQSAILSLLKTLVAPSRNFTILFRNYSSWRKATFSLHPLGSLSFLSRSPPTSTTLSSARWSVKAAGTVSMFLKQCLSAAVVKTRSIRDEPRGWWNVWPASSGRSILQTSVSSRLLIPEGLSYLNFRRFRGL